MSFTKVLVATGAVTLLTASAAVAQNPVGLPPPTRDDSAAIWKAPGYSPYAGRHFPTNVYWGDTHVHTDNSLDGPIWYTP